jgi:hypothetical protein
MTFKEFFLKESDNEVTKITNPNGSYKIKYLDGATERYRIDEDPHTVIDYAYIDKLGYLHSPDNNTPAMVANNINDNTTSEIWYNHGLVHRDGDLPSQIDKDSIGEHIVVFYHKNGKKHRLTGPAVFIRDEDNNSFRLHYYINNVSYTKEGYDEYTKGLESKEDKELLSDLGQTFD